MLGLLGLCTCVSVKEIHPVGIELVLLRPCSRPVDTPIGKISIYRIIHTCKYVGDKKTVYEWYNNDCQLWPHIYVECQCDWFIKTWQKYYGSVGSD